jgi:hypothetical protein
VVTGGGGCVVRCRITSIMRGGDGPVGPRSLRGQAADGHTEADARKKRWWAEAE